MWPALAEDGAPPKDRMIYIAMRSGHSLRLGDWKLIVRGKNKPELFNIAADPYEKNDLADGEPEKVAQLHELMIEHLKGRDPWAFAELCVQHLRPNKDKYIGRLREAAAETISAEGRKNPAS